MKDIKPLIPVNIQGLEELAKELLNETQVVIPSQTDITDPKKYLILPSKTYGNYSYPDLLVSTSRLGYDNGVEKAAKKLNLTLQNTANEQDNTPYIGKIQHKQALDLNLALDGLTLNIRQFADFLNLLKSGKAFYADGSKADKTLLDNMLDEITTVRASWRAEWFDNSFGKNTTTYHKFNTNGKLVEVTEDLDPDTLMEDRTPGIDLNSWLRNPTAQGLPRKTVPNGDSYYWPPKDGYVARFFANSDRAILNCYRSPQGSGPVLGVRHAKIRK